MHSHLVPVEVRIVSGTHEWVNTDRIPFNQYGDTERRLFLTTIESGQFRVVEQ